MKTFVLISVDFLRDGGTMMVETSAGNFYKSKSSEDYCIKESNGDYDKFSVTKELTNYINKRVERYANGLIGQSERILERIKNE